MSVGPVLTTITSYTILLIMHVDADNVGCSLSTTDCEEFGYPLLYAQVFSARSLMLKQSKTLLMNFTKESFNIIIIQNIFNHILSTASSQYYVWDIDLLEKIQHPNLLADHSNLQPLFPLLLEATWRLDRAIDQ